MKKNKKQKSEKQNESLSLLRRRLALSKLQERRKKEKSGAEQQRKAVFEKKLLRYPSKHAPKTQRTRAYYRFTKDYPMAVDSNGFRDNSPAKKRTAKKKALWILSVFLVFLASFMITKTCIYLSHIEPLPVTGSDNETLNTLSAFLHFSYDDEALKDADKLNDVLKKYGCTGALIEIKDESGKIHLDSAEEAVKNIKEAGAFAAAYISCFKDSVSADENSAFRVRKNSANGEKWTDNSGSGWLNPFSEEARNYILNTIKKASSLGFDIIVLDNLCFPSDSGSSAAYYYGESEWTGTRNKLLQGFANDALISAGSAETLLLCSFSAFDADGSADRAPYYGNMLTVGAGILCADARLSRQPKNVSIGAEKFADPSEIPYAFILSAGEYAALNAGTKKAFLCFEKDENLKSVRDAAVFSGVSGYIIW